jgi:hypothetical protein
MHRSSIVAPRLSSSARPIIERLGTHRLIAGYPPADNGTVRATGEDMQRMDESAPTMATAGGAMPQVGPAPAGGRAPSPGLPVARVACGHH